MKRLNSAYPTCAIILVLAATFIPPSFARAWAGRRGAQRVSPAGQLSNIIIDGGSVECILGPAESLRGIPGWGWANKLTPPSYPATLRTIAIAFNRGAVGLEVKQDDLYRVAVYLDPGKTGPADNQLPAATFIARVRGIGQSLMTYNLDTPVTIQSGSFDIAVLDDYGIANHPAIFSVPGLSMPPGSDSFVTFNAGGKWGNLRDPMTLPPTQVCPPASFIIRATVETGSADVLAATKIKDPLAVEPWSVAATASQVIVANYVSDNLTVIKTSDNSFRNIPVGDGPGGAADGPFGVAIDAAAGKAYVTLFGSNTIPSKEFPIDYSTVGSGRVVVLAKQADGSLAPNLTLNVAKGPRFPALVSGDKKKLYVPCGGGNVVDVIDTALNQKIAEIAVGKDPSSCTASLDNTKVYVTNFGDGTISVIDTKTDQKVKDIPPPPLPVPATIKQGVDPVPPPIAAFPWSSVISPVNGDLYVTYWGTAADMTQNGGIVEFDTCGDQFVRAVIDDTTRGTPAGSAGATGIPAPTAPLVRDASKGSTPGAGGGGGGPFGLASCSNALLPFTNDGSAVLGILDTRINQVISAPALSDSACPKLRGVACVPPRASQLSNDSTAYAACGQPDNSVLVVNLPAVTENIPDVPIIESFSLGGKLVINGTGFTNETRIEVVAPGSSACLTFIRAPKLRNGGATLMQKGGLIDGRSVSEAVPRGQTAIIKVINGDGSIRIVQFTRS